MGLKSFIIRRFIRGIITLWFVVTIVFFATRFTGDPLDFLISPEAGMQARQETMERLGLDRPLSEQYLIYMRGVLQGDFGESFFRRRPASEVFFARLPATLRLMGVSMLIIIVLGIAVGILSAAKHNTPLDRFLMALSFSAYSIPNFVLGIVLIFIFSLLLRRLPSGGYNGWQNYIMPSITLAAYQCALVARIMRSSMLDVFRQDYVVTARAKGLSEATVVLKHCLRNAFSPVMTLLGMLMITLVGGSVVIEKVFSWPGAGSLIVDSVMRRDFPVLQLAVVVVAVITVLINTLVDIGYSILDPRVRSEME